MKKYGVLYYSKTGNSKFLARRISEALGCDLIEVTPTMNSVFPLFLMSLVKLGIGTDISSKKIGEYEEVVVIGPVWGGTLISPLRSILKKCVQASTHIHFAVTCETSDEQKDDRYGYARVLKEAETTGGDLIRSTGAFPTPLVMRDGESSNPKISEKIKITEENFKGVMESRLEAFITNMTAS